MITKETLEQLRKNQQKPHFGSEAKSMFVNGKFNLNNWNGGDGIIRQYTSWGDTQNCWEVDWKAGEHTHSGHVIVQNVYFEDFYYVTLIAHGYDCDNEKTEWYLDQYLIQYYKSRGKTDRILYNGQLITEDQYLVLLNMIESTGFAFDI